VSGRQSRKTKSIIQRYQYQVIGVISSKRSQLDGERASKCLVELHAKFSFAAQEQQDECAQMYQTTLS